MIPNKQVRIAILDLYNGVENEGMRCIKKIVNDFGINAEIRIDCQIFDVRQHTQLPDLSFDIYISTGGPGSPAPEGHPWERKYFRFLDTLWQYNKKHHNRSKKYLFLICHSFQLASNHWQIGKVCKRRSNSFGTFPVHQTHAGHKDPYFAELSDPFWVVDSRDYQIIEPNYHVLEHLGAKIICLEKKRPHVPLDRAIMAIRFSNEIFGTQFHPEADAEGMLRYFLKEDKKQNVIKNHGEEKYQSMINHLNDPDKILLTESVILPTFLNVAIQRIVSLQPA
jgi:GMP synthase-like glutamine amidotransferase